MPPKAAGRFAAVPVLEFAIKQGLPVSGSVFCAAVEANHLEKAQWIVQQHCGSDLHLKAHEMMHAAVASGSTEMVEWALDVLNTHEDLSPNDIWKACILSAARDQQMVEYLYDADCPADTELVGMTARRGDLPLLKWLIAEEFPVAWADILHDAATSGSIEMLEWSQAE